MKKFDFILFSLFVFAFFLFSCSKVLFKVDIDEIGTYPQPLIQPLPIRVGVYYGNVFGTSQTIIKVKHSPTSSDYEYFVNAKMGKANIALFNYIFSHVFKEVTFIQNFREESENLADIDIIIKPKVKDCSSYHVVGLSKCEYHLFLKYFIMFYLPNKKPIGSWTIKGEGFVPYDMSFPQTLAKEGINIAMGEVAAKFMTDFCNQASIKKLFYNECNQ